MTAGLVKWLLFTVHTGTVQKRILRQQVEKLSLLSEANKAVV